MKRLVSPAKINLGLSIVGKRDDGYHLLESLFWPVNLSDEMTFEPASQNLVSTAWNDEAPVKTRGLPSMEENTAYKFLEKTGTNQKWKVDISKRIPLAGGLGGSSSNAGTVGRFLKPAHAEETAVSLGADIPYFLDPKPTWVTGIGEVRTALDVEESLMDSLRFILVFPPAQCNTSEIFSAYRAAQIPFSSPRNFPTRGKLGLSELSFYLATAKNDLESVVAAKEPVIGETLEVLRQTKPLFASLSGSGSTCYAAYLSDADCEINLKDLHQFCRKTYCKSIKVQTYRTHD